MSAPKRLETQLETQVVAMIARGDTQQSIADWLLSAHGLEVAVNTISVIKGRNAEALKFMQAEIVKHETSAVTTLLSKSRRLTDSQLDKALKLDEEISLLQKQRDSGDINDGQYYSRLDIAMRNRLSIAELNSVMKESFNQSQIEAGKPTSIADNPTQARANLEKLLTAIAHKDEEAMLKAIFPSA